MRTICRISLSPDSCVKQSELRFQRWRGRVLLIAKFVPGLSTVAPPLVGAMGLRPGPSCCSMGSARCCGPGWRSAWAMSFARADRPACSSAIDQAGAVALEAAAGAAGAVYRWPSGGSATACWWRCAWRASRWTSSNQAIAAGRQSGGGRCAFGGGRACSTRGSFPAPLLADLDGVDRALARRAARPRAGDLLQLPERGVRGQGGQAADGAGLSPGAPAAGRAGCLGCGRLPGRTAAAFRRRSARCPRPDLRLSASPRAPTPVRNGPTPFPASARWTRPGPRL